MQRFTHQRGLSIVSVTAFITIFGIFALVAIRLIPVYSTNFTIKGILDGVKQNYSEYQSPGDVRSAISKRMQVNSIEVVNGSDVAIEEVGNNYVVDLDYEVRVPFINNISFIVEFNNHAEVPAR